MINGYLRTYRAAVDGLAGMRSETQFQALADSGVELANIFQEVGISGSVLVSDRPGWTELEARLHHGDTRTVAALDRLSRNRIMPHPCLHFFSTESPASHGRGLRLYRDIHPTTMTIC